MKQNRPLSRLRIWQFRLFSISLALLLFVIILLVLEGLIRLMYGDKINVQYTTRNLYQDSLFSAQTHGWKAGEIGSCNGKGVKINSYGLRGPALDLSASEKKLLLLGDSVLFGPGLEYQQTISGILMDSTDYIIINTAVIGYNTSDYIEVLKVWLSKTNIHHVMVFLCLNDVYRYNTVVKSSGFLKVLLDYLRTNSKLYMFLKNLISDRSKFYFLHDIVYFDESDVSYQEAMKDFIRMRDLCQEKNIPFDVVILPYEYQIRTHHIKTNWTPQRMLADFFTKQRIGFLVPDSSIFNPAHSRSYYLYADGIHLSSKGHQVLAKSVMNYLTR